MDAHSVRPSAWTLRHFRLRTRLSPGSDIPEAVRVTIEAGSIDTHGSRRDAHLTSADFFESAKYPTLSFESTGIETTAVGFQMLGKLIIVSDEVRSELIEYSRRVHRPGRIDRYDFGVSWNDQMPDGRIVVSRDIEIILDVKAIKQDELHSR